MEAPEIRYTRTPDGTRVGALASAGELPGEWQLHAVKDAARRPG